jgi:RNA polymerase sigma-70 factor (ECF subfamily)
MERYSERYSDFNKVYVEHKAMVFNFVLIRTNNREVSEEITNDVFVKIAECMDIFNPEKSKFTTWMLNITKNKIIDYYRSLETAAKLGEVYISDFMDESGKEKMQVMAADYEDSMENVELRTKIDMAFEVLKDIEKQVADLYIKQDKQYKEIADLLDIPIGSVKGYLSRARAKMQNYLKDVYAN